MGIRAMKQPSFGDVPVSVLVQLAQEPARFEAELTRYAEAKTAAEEAEARTTAARKEAQAALADFETARSSFLEDQKRVQADIMAKQTELAAGWSDLNERQRAIDARSIKLDEIEAVQRSKASEFATRKAELDTQFNSLGSRADVLAKRQAKIEADEENLAIRLKSFGDRVAAMRAPL